MTPTISPPPPDVIAELMATHAHRFPEKATITVPGDSGAFVRLPLLLGIPTGAAAMPDGARIAPAWANEVATAMRLRPSTDPMGSALVADCLLYPPPLVWRQWRARWAAIDGEARSLVGDKIGSRLSVLEEPGEDEQPPNGITPTPTGLWRILRPQGQRFDCVVEPPDADMWRMFATAIAKDAAEAAPRARQIVEGCVTQFTPGTLSDALTRWPGLAVALTAAVAHLAGTAASGALGEW